MRIFKAIVWLILIVGMLGFIGYSAFNNYYTNAVENTDGTSEYVQVEIPSGSSSTDIAKILSEKNLIDSELIFSLYLRNINAGAELKAGKYEFSNDMSMAEIVQELRQGAIAKGVTVTIPEGLRSDEITKIIANGFINAELTNISEVALNQIVASPETANLEPNVKAFLATNKPTGKTLEGFLYPDTYEFAKDTTPEAIISKLVSNLISKYETITPSVEASKYTFYQNLILASLVEKEATGNAAERQEVAGIFLRRLNIGEKIGSDSSVLYPYKRWKPEPTAAELRANNPYNTRLNYGLPPTPIANPGVVSLRASFTATPSQYLFFIHDSKGNVYYAKTLSEQTANINKYLR